MWPEALAPIETEDQEPQAPREHEEDFQENDPYSEEVEPGLTSSRKVSATTMKNGKIFQC